MLEINLSQKQTVSQQMVMSATILQMNSLELEAYLQNLTLENPVIELDDNRQHEDPGQMEIERKIDWLEENDYQNRAYYHDEKESMGSREDIWDGNKKQEMSLAEYLRLQLMPEHFAPRERRIIEYLIDSLDSRGYFVDGIKATAGVLHVEEASVEKMLGILQGLDPSGVGARDLRECLLLQLKAMPEETVLAERVVGEYLEKLGKNHMKAIARGVGITTEKLLEICEVIRSLNPKPGSAFFTGEEACYIRPDIFVMEDAEEKGKFRIIIRNGMNDSFHINDYYQNLEKETKDSQTRKYLKEKLSQADFVAKGIENRKITMYRVVGAIVNRQADFFLSPEGYRKPLKLSELAEDLDLHESTVSRALKGKYLQCARGIYPLRYFLTSQAAGDDNNSEDLTPEIIKEEIERLVREEDKRKPLSDSAIQNLLEQKGMHVARRTVNKYRQELGIPDKTGRKEW